MKKTLTPVFIPFLILISIFFFYTSYNQLTIFSSQNNLAAITPPPPTPPPVGPPSQINLSPLTATVVPGATLQLKATVFDDNDNLITNLLIRWTSDNTTAGSPSSTGLVTTSTSTPDGTIVHITATVIKPVPQGIVAATSTITLMRPSLPTCGTIDATALVPNSGFSYLLLLFANGGDSSSGGNVSNVVLYENGKPLGPAHSVHNTIRTVGNGAYSHWRNSLYLSASDNSDPRTNGRVYTYKVSGGSCPIRVCGTINATAATPDNGFSYLLAKNFGFKGDTSLQPTQSSLAVFEDDGIATPKTLGLAHSALTTIRAVGNGAFSHLGNALYFSASNNTDPRTNGKVYTYGGSCRALVPIQFTQISTTSPLYATFQSHNQKVVENSFGIFMTYLDTEYTGQYGANWGNLHLWKLLRSVDGGKTFKTVFQSTNYTKAPTLETDEYGNLYLFASNYFPGASGGGSTVLYRFLSANNFTSPATTTVMNAAAGKFSAFYDKTRKQIYYFTFNGAGPDFYVFDTNGKLIRSMALIINGPNAVLQYPHLSMDNSGQLFAGWTSSAVLTISPRLYWDIHFMVSNDGGLTWTKGDGTPLALPVIADDTGAADEIILPDEFNVHTWLSNMIYRGGALHFMYEAQFNYPNAREHYVRYDLTKKKIDLNTYPVWAGEKLGIQSSDGFFTSDPLNSNALLYAISTDRYTTAGANRISVLASDDNGQTWFDYAISAPFIHLYAIGGSRTTGASNYIFGSFTNLVNYAKQISPPNSSEVWFFKVKAQ